MTTPESAPRRLQGRWSAATARYRAWAAPTPDGLPRASVLLWFPALLLIVGTILALVSINGTSSGQYHARIESGSDPQLIAGHPVPIRSDEWNVGTSWSLGQVEQGLPVTNETFPGGMDAAIPHDLPRADWDVAFRPHLIGYLFLDPGQATAWRWWSLSLLTMAAAYALAVTLMPRRPLSSAALAIGFFAAPFFQWWFQSSTFAPAAWGLVAMTAIVWAARSSSRIARWSWAAVAGYLTVVMAMGLYAPFIIPVVLVVAGLGIAVALRMLISERAPRRLLRLVPILVAGGVAGAIVLVWLRVKETTVAAFLSTDYPGERLSPPGSGGALILARAIASPFAESLKRGNGLLGTNSSEASMFFLAGLFLIPVVAWLVVRRARNRGRQPWELLGVLAAAILLLAYIVVPGWDAIAHLLLLDRTMAQRTVIGLGVASFAAIPLLVSELEREDRRPARWVAWGSAGLFALVELAIAGALALHLGIDGLFAVAPLWPVFLLLSAACILLFALRRPGWGAAAFLVVSVASTFNVNPIYLGVYDMRDSAPADAIEEIDAADPGTWVGIGSTLPSALLIETGVRAYNGVQGAPSDEMWSEIDPDGEYTYQWNRLGGISWDRGTGEPVVSNPAPDQIRVVFDACDPFAQENVQYAVTDDGPLTSPCLRQVDEVELVDGQLRIYEVVPAG